MRILAEHGIATALRYQCLVRILPEHQAHGSNLHFVFPSGKFMPANVMAFIDVAIRSDRNTRPAQSRIIGAFGNFSHTGTNADTTTARHMRVS
jgi:hypothetical protein